MALATRRQCRAAFSGARKKLNAAFAFDGDRSPAESADKSAHSKTGFGASGYAVSVCGFRTAREIKLRFFRFTMYRE
jgi:hypothetical protein